MDSIRSLGTTLAQMGSNAWNNPSEFVGYGLKTTKNAVNEKLTIKLPSERSTNFEENTHWGSRIKDSFTSSQPAKAKPKQHAFNMLTPGERNIHGGSFDFRA